MIASCPMATVTAPDFMAAYATLPGIAAVIHVAITPSQYLDYVQAWFRKQLQLLCSSTVYHAIGSYMAPTPLMSMSVGTHTTEAN